MPNKDAMKETFSMFCMEQLMGQDTSMGVASHLVEDQMLKEYIPDERALGQT